MGSQLCKCDDQELESRDRVTEQIPQVVAPVVDDVRLMVAIAGARGLRSKDWKQSKRPSRGGALCTVEVKTHAKNMRFRTQPAEDVIAPVWRTEIAMPDYSQGSPLQFTVTDDAGTGAILGRATLMAADFAAAGFNGELPLTGGQANGALLKVKVRNRGQDYPLVQSNFAVDIEKSDAQKPLGLDLDVQDRAYAYIVKVDEGPLMSYNEEAPEAVQVRAGDFIAKVNDIEGDVSSMLNLMTSTCSLRLLLSRPDEFSVWLTRDDAAQPLGLCFPKSTSGRSLLIVGIVAGAVQDWNTHHIAHEVRAGDRIVSVDGEEGDASELLKKVQPSLKVLLSLVRPAHADSWRYW